ncbi:cytochrome P450 3A29 [Morus notabilis]|uniref:cytochrome P450 3A29 n=1 Tax=Morus notabilis TaxID=981085 RepID=UPI000CECFD92|nr:cytochrome P450 3A29 [Morus notabilis]
MESSLTTLLCALFPARFSFDACEESPRIMLRDLAAREFNAFLWISLIAITALLISEVFKLLRLWRKGKWIPGPPCPSFHGHGSLISRENLTDVLSESHENYGSVVKLWLGPTQLLVSIKDPNLIKEMLFKAADKLPLTGRAFRLAFGRSSLFASSFDKVQKRREALMTNLSERLLVRANVIPGKVVECIMERIQKSMAKGSVDCRMVSQHMAFTILGTTLFGDPFLAWSKASVYEELLMMIAKDACFWASYNVTPFWKRGFWKYQQLCTKLKRLTQDIIQQCRRSCKIFHCMDDDHCNETAGTGKNASYGASYCSDGVIPENFFFHEFKGHMNEREDEPSSNIMGMMFHGCLTTTGLINNILMRLVTHPEIQDKIYTEITLAQKDSMTPVEQNVDKMLLLLATVYESARLLPAGPLLQRCSLDHDLNLETGATIPAGALLVVPVQLLQKDGSSWGSDAGEFNPYRFLSKTRKRSNLVNTSFSEQTTDLEEGTFVLNDPNENAAFLPFGSGIRSCVGQKFVIQVVATFFASLLKHYEIKLPAQAQSNEKPKKNNCGFQLLPSTEIVFLSRSS